MSRYTPNAFNILNFWYTILLLWRWLNFLPVWGYHAKCCTAKTNIPFHTVDPFQLEDVVLLGCLCLTSLSNHPVSCCLGLTCLLSFDFVTKHLHCFPYMSYIQRPKYNNLLIERIVLCFPPTYKDLSNFGITMWFYQKKGPLCCASVSPSGLDPRPLGI